MKCIAWGNNAQIDFPNIARHPSCSKNCSVHAKALLKPFSIAVALPARAERTYNVSTFAIGASSEHFPAPFVRADTLESCNDIQLSWRASATDFSRD